MRILFREPINQPLKLMEIANDIDDIQELVGGFVTGFCLRGDILCLVDEDGLCKELSNNFYDDNQGWIVGNVVFCGMSDDGTEFTSLTNEQLNYIEEYIGFPIVDKRA